MKTYRPGEIGRHERWLTDAEFEQWGLVDPLNNAACECGRDWTTCPRHAPTAYSEKAARHRNQSVKAGVIPVMREDVLMHRRIRKGW